MFFFQCVCGCVGGGGGSCFGFIGFVLQTTSCNYMFSVQRDPYGTTPADTIENKMGMPLWHICGEDPSKASTYQNKIRAFLVCQILYTAFSVDR